jgi:hypothetical protein
MTTNSLNYAYKKYAGMETHTASTIFPITKD